MHFIFSVAAFVFALSAGLVVLIKNHESKINKQFFIFSLLIAVIYFSDSLLRLADVSEHALMRGKIYCVLLLFMPAMFLMFTTVFPKDRMVGIGRMTGILKLLMFLPPVLFTFFVNTYFNGVYYTNSFNPVLSGKIVVVYFVVYLVLGLRNFNVSLKEPDTRIKKMQSAYAVIGISIYMFVLGLTDFIFPSYGFLAFRLGSIFVLVMYSFISYSIHRHYLFVSEPLAEECSAAEFQKYSLSPSTSILIKDRSFHENFNVFLDQVLHGRSGLCLTRTNPKRILQEYPLKRTPVLWLTELNVKDCINPADLEELGYTIERFIGTADSGVVYLDGVEYLTTYNGFLKTLHLIQDIKDKVSLVNSSLLIPVKSAAFETVQLRLLERELDRL